MFDTNENRQIEYQQLIQALIHCPQNSEDRVLAANPHLVDEGLVKALRSTAEMMINPNDPAEASTIEWLFNFAEQLAQKFGGEKNRRDFESFCIDLLQAVADSHGDGKIVQEFFDEHLTYLTEQLLALLPQQVKELLEREDELEWKFHIASTVGNLGNELQQFPRGTRAINLELAIACYDCALLVLTQANFPIEWATTENNRASAHNDRIEGDRSANLESAIAGYDRALLVLTQADFPIEWATTENNRASAYSDRIEGDRSANLESAIAGYDRALLVLTPADFPLESITTETNRSRAYSDWFNCNEDLNIEGTIAANEPPLDSIQQKLNIPAETQIISPNEEQQSAYQDLIKLLLECPHGQEYRLLAAHPELADEGLIMALVDTAEIKADSGDADAIEVTQWLVNFAEQLAGKLGFEVSDVAEIEREDEDYIEFSIELLQTVANSEGDASIVHQFLDTHLDYLTPTLLATFPKLIEGLLEQEEDLDRKSYIISTLYNLSIDLSEFPHGDRSVTIQLSIACQEQYLSVVTETAERIKRKEAQQADSILQETLVNDDRIIDVFGEDDYWNVFIELFQTVADSNGNNKSVHQFFDERIHYLNSTFLNLFPAFIEKLFAQLHNAEMTAQTALWFNNLAVNLAEYPRGDRSINLGLAIACHEQALVAKTQAIESIESPIAVNEPPQITYVEIDEDDDWGFFVELFKTVQNSQGDRNVVYQFLDQHLTHLNPSLVALFPAFLTKFFAVFNDADTIAKIASDCHSLSIYLREFPNGNRSINMELSIACYERDRLIHTQGDVPIESKTIENIPLLHPDETNLVAIDPTTNHDASSSSLAAKEILDLERQRKDIYLKICHLDPVIAGETEVAQLNFTSIQKLTTQPHTAILTCCTTANDTHIFIIKQGEPIIHTLPNQGWQKFQKWLQTAWIDTANDNMAKWQKDLPRLLHNISNRLQLDTIVKQHLTDITELIILPNLNLHQIPFAALPIIGTDYLLGDKFTIRSIPSERIHQDSHEPRLITLWSVDDLVTTIFAHSYHQELQKGLDCAEAIQAAQQQLRNLTQEELTATYYPQAIEHITAYNPTLLPNLAASIKVYSNYDRPFDHPYFWAAFSQSMT